MKRITVIIFLLHCAFQIKAQNTYSEAIKQGDAAFAKGDYRVAINKYFAAEAFEPSKREGIKEKVNSVFDKIESLRKDAEKAKSSAIKSEKKAILEAELARKQELLAKKEKARNDTLISRMVFLNNRGWVSNLNSKSALIDNLGNLITEYMFSEPGFLPNVNLFTGYDSYGNYCLIDSTGQILLETEYIMLCNNSSILIKSHNMFTIIPFNFNWDNLDSQFWYNSIGNFCEGYTFVNLYNKFYLINEYGEISDTGYDEAYDFNEGRAWARFGDEWVVVKINKPKVTLDTIIGDKRKQTINTIITYHRFSSQIIKTREVNGKEYSRDTISKKRFSEVKPFHNETSWVKDNDKGLWGKINMDGKYIISPEFDSIESIDIKFTKVILNGKSGVIDENNEIIISPVYDEIEYWVDSIFRVTSNNKIGCIDNKGKVLFEPIFENVYQFRDSTFLVCSNYKYGWADINGKLIIDTIYSGGYIFENNKAVAYLNKKPFIINKRGELLHKLPYTNTSLFSEGLLWVSNGGLWGLIDTSMTELIPPMFFEVRDFKNDEAWVKYHGWGLISKDNPEYIIPPLFDDFWYSGRDKELWVKAGIKWGTFNKNEGKWNIPPFFDKVYNDIYGNVCVQKGNDYYVIDEFGQIIIK